MKWLFNKCGRYAVDLSLLAAGALAETERTALEVHLAECVTCRAKLAELRNLTRGLAEAGQRLPEVEAPAALRRRWMMAVRGSDAVSDGAPGTARPDTWFSGWWSGRRLAWGSLTAMWALVLFFRCSAPDASKPASLASAPPVSLREVLLALKVEHLSPLLRADAGKPSRPKLTAPDALPPRSQRSPASPADLEVA